VQLVDDLRDPIVHLLTIFGRHFRTKSNLVNFKFVIHNALL
jgi:hypothetical protein